MRLVRRLAFTLIVLAAPALAAPNPYGLNLAWTHCYDDGGTANRQFACNTNAGLERLVLSFVVDQPIQNFCGITAYLQLAAESPALPSWWSMHNAGTCRQTSLSFSAQPPDPLSTVCFDWGAAMFGSSGIGNYNIGVPNSNSVTLAAVNNVPQGLGLGLNPGVQYFTGQFVINHAKTVGSGGCPGCQTPVCILFSHMQMYVDGSPNPFRVLTSPANTPNSQLATWQSGQFFGLQHNCDQAGNCTNSFLCATQPVSSRHGTWGAVKSLYR